MTATRMRRWIVRILVTLVILLIAGAVAVQVVLTSDLPRRIIVDVLEDQTGLRFSIRAMDTGWGGRTVVRDIAVGLPLETDPFAEIPRLSLSHTDLIRLVVFRSLEIKAAGIEQPRITLTQDAEGQWNLLQAVAIVEQRQAALNGEGGDLPPLPALDVDDFYIDITSLNRQVTYGPLALRGRPEDALAWAFTLHYADASIASGRLAPRAGWAHRVDFELQDIHRLIAPWMDQPPPPLHAAGNWSGQVDRGALDGRLHLETLTADRITAAGDIAVHIAGATAVISPVDLTATMHDSGIGPVHLRGGTITAEADLVRADRLLVNVMDIESQINGRWQPRGEEATVTLAWAGRLAEMDADHEGTITARLHMPDVGRSSITATADFFGQWPQGRWSSRWDIDGRGSTWRDAIGGISAAQLTVFTEDQTIDLAGFTCRFTSSWPLVQLTHVDLPGAVTRGRGQIDLQQQTWSLNLTARNWQVPALNADAVNLHLQAAGDPTRINLDNFQLTQGEYELTAGGVYLLQRQQPLDFRAHLRGPLEQPELSGRFETDLSLTGIVQPLDVSLDGTVHVRELSWQGRRLDDLTIPIHGSAQRDAATFRSPRFEMFDGVWELQARYDRPLNFATASLDASNASVGQLGAFVDAPMDIDGIVSAEVDVRLPRMDFSLLQVQGQWQASALSGPGLVDADGRGRVTLINDQLRLHEMHLEHNGGSLAGSASADLNDMRRVSIELTANNWPIDDPRFEPRGHVSGAATLDVDVIDLLADGELRLNIDATLDERPLGLVDVHATVAGRTIDLHEMHGSGLGGGLSGAGQVHLTDATWTQSWLDLEWWDIDLGSIPLRFDEARELIGSGSGTLKISRAEDRRAPEPMRIDLAMDHRDARYGPIEIGSLDLTGYLGRERIMIDQSTAHAIGGTIELWGRITRHEGEPFVHVHVELDNIDLKQIAALRGVDDEPVVGRIAGGGSAGGYLSPPHRLFGQSNLTLVNSDIAALPGIAQLYSLLNVDFGRSEPTGRGEMLVRLEGDALNIARLTYFNRGTDIVARLRMQDIWLGSHTPIDGLAAGTLRPLRDLNLPLIGDNLDRLLGAVQANAASVRIGGTLEEPDVQVVPLAEITGALGRIIRGSPE